MIERNHSDGIESKNLTCNVKLVCTVYLTASPQITSDALLNDRNVKGYEFKSTWIMAADVAAVHRYLLLRTPPDEKFQISPRG